VPGLNLQCLRRRRPVRALLRVWPLTGEIMSPGRPAFFSTTHVSVDDDSELDVFQRWFVQETGESCYILALHQAVRNEISLIYSALREGIAVSPK
jgi:hypothetical protein